MNSQCISFNELPQAVAELHSKINRLEQLLLEKSDNRQQSEVEQLLTVEEAAKFLKLSIPTIYSKVSKGELPVMKQGKRLYFSNIELIAYLKEGKKKSYAEIESEAEAYMKKGGRR